MASSGENPNTAELSVTCIQPLAHYLRTSMRVKTTCLYSERIQKYYEWFRG